MRYTLATITVLTSWLWMQSCHELGHVALALATGATVENVNLFPTQLSRTDIGLNPRPLLVVWGGPVVGVLLPLTVWLGAWALRSPHAFLARFFAGFCLVANGAYIGVGSFDRVGDCGDMLRHGTPIWVLWAFGVAGVCAGFLCWHHLGHAFGFGRDAKPVTRSSVVIAGTTLLAGLAVSLAVGS